MSHVLLNVAFVSAALVVAAAGALQCFWPEKLKEIQSRFPLSHNPESPGGRLFKYLQNKQPGPVYRLSGLLLLATALLMIATALGYRP